MCCMKHVTAHVFIRAPQRALQHCAQAAEIAFYCEQCAESIMPGVAHSLSQPSHLHIRLVQELGKSIEFIHIALGGS